MSIKVCESQCGEKVIFSSDLTGEANTASNVGSGDGWFLQKTGLDLEFKTFIVGSNLSITSNALDLTLDFTGTLGEINTASNIGAGEGVFFQKTVSDLELKSITVGDGMTISSSTTEIDLEAPCGCTTEFSEELLDQSLVSSTLVGSAMSAITTAGTYMIHAIVSGAMTADAAATFHIYDNNGAANLSSVATIVGLSETTSADIASNGTYATMIFVGALAVGVIPAIRVISVSGTITALNRTIFIQRVGI